jgi:hypothetical protein
MPAYGSQIMEIAWRPAYSVLTFWARAAREGYGDGVTVAGSMTRKLIMLLGAVRRSPDQLEKRAQDEVDKGRQRIESIEREV